jgi:hypothetical protein
MSPNETTTSFRRLRFYRDKNTRWYAAIPEYPGPKEDLEMVLGADDLLDRLSFYGDALTVRVSEQPFEDALHLERHHPDEHIGSGADYWDHKNKSSLWLCDVTKYVYGGRFPEHLYVQRVLGYSI